MVENGDAEAHKRKANTIESPGKTLAAMKAAAEN